MDIDDIYIEQLKKYLGENAKIFRREKGIEVFHTRDIEIQYLLENTEKGYALSLIERGVKRYTMVEYFLESEKEIKRKLALTLKTHFEEEIDYKKWQGFHEIKNFEECKKQMNLYLEPEYYSIMQPQARKFNLEKEQEQYNIYFLYDSGEKKYYEKGINVSDAFFHLYYDAFLFKRGIKHIEEYQILFDDKIENIYDYLI